MFAANAATAALAVTLKNDELAEGDADFTVEVKPGDGYTLGDPALATVTVTDASDPGAVKPEHLQAIVGPGPRRGGSTRFRATSTATRPTTSTGTGWRFPTAGSRPMR